MADPFEAQAERKRSLIPAIGSAGRKRAFLAEIETMLATAQRVTEVAPDRVRALAREQELELTSDIANPRRRLYRRLFEHCLADFALSAEEREDLDHLRALLCLDDEDVAAAQDEAACAIYGKAVAEVLDDYRVDSDEKEFLRALRCEIGLEEDRAESLESQAASDARRRFINRKVVLDRPVLPGESAAVELEGASDRSLEEAVQVAVQSAAITVPKLQSAELKALRVEVDGEAIKRWSVTLTASL